MTKQQDSVGQNEEDRGTGVAGQLSVTAKLPLKLPAKSFYLVKSR